MARLIVASSGTERTIELTREKALSVGREPSNDVALPEERQASRRHCEVRASASGWEVVDLGATNKTRVNGQPVDRRALASGDVIEVGKVTLRFEDADEDARLQAAGRQGVCFLEWTDGPQKGQRVLLDRPRTTLGRRESNTIPLDDRMASGHHAEIVRDLNGYTVRDLGSTNGILVNGGPTTEAPLAHGTRLRVGNSRFVFKDPSMKDVEVELARLEDDDGWGMMGDIDLSRAPGGVSGILALLIVLGVAGAGGWYVWNEGQQIRTRSAEASAERIVNGDFEAAELPWSWNEDAPLRVGRTGAGGGQALQVALEDAPGARPELVTYQGDFGLAEGRVLDVKARLKGTGELLLIWHTEAERATGTTGVTRPVVLGSGGSVGTRVAFPSWATTLRLALRVAPGQRLTLDDLSVTPVADADGGAVAQDPPGLAQAVAEADGSLTLAVRRTVLAVGGLPIAWKDAERLAFRPQGAPRAEGGRTVVAGAFVGGGQELAGQVAYAVTADGLEAEVGCPGATRTGLQLDLPRAHLPQLNVLTPTDARAVPLGVGPLADAVVKALAGSPDREGQRPPTLLSFGAAEGTFVLSQEEAPDPGLVRLALLQPGAAARLRTVTDFTPHAQAAAGALAAAKELVRSSPGAAIRALRKVAQEYPFEARVQSEASTLAAELEGRSTKDLGELKAALQAFRILGSPAAVADLQRRSTALAATFLTGAEAPAEGSFEAEVAATTRAVSQAVQAHATALALPQVERLDRAASMLEGEPGFRAMAAVVYRSIVEAYGASAGEEGPLAAQVARARARLAELEQQPDVATALPPR